MVYVHVNNRMVIMIKYLELNLDKILGNSLFRVLQLF